MVLIYSGLLTCLTLNLSLTGRPFSHDTTQHSMLRQGHTQCKTATGILIENESRKRDFIHK